VAISVVVLSRVSTSGPSGGSPSPMPPPFGNRGGSSERGVGEDFRRVQWVHGLSGDGVMLDTYHQCTHTHTHTPKREFHTLSHYLNLPTTTTTTTFYHHTNTLRIHPYSSLTRLATLAVDDAGSTSSSGSSSSSRNQ
jgi:hypothetical protein